MSMCSSDTNMGLNFDHVKPDARIIVNGAKTAGGLALLSGALITCCATRAILLAAITAPFLNYRIIFSNIPINDKNIIIIIQI